jgi:hypothetical protein
MKPLPANVEINVDSQGMSWTPDHYFRDFIKGFIFREETLRLSSYHTIVISLMDNNQLPNMVLFSVAGGSTTRAVKSLTHI